MAVDSVAAAPRLNPPRSAPRQMALANSGFYFAGLVLIALIAFWPTYLSQRPGSSSAYTHLHAVTATLWMLLLVAQPMAIRTRSLATHRVLGRASYALAPLVLVTMVLLAHSRMQSLGPDAYAIQTYILYLQISLAAVFALSYGLGILKRRDTGLHARFMVCTGLTLIDPVVIRLMFWIEPTPTWNYQWFTFGLTDIVLLTLIWQERQRAAPRAVFTGMLVLFVLSQLPALLGLTGSPLWQAFAGWFAALPLT